MRSGRASNGSRVLGRGLAAGVAAVLTAALLSGGPAPARAQTGGSIVFIRDSNVWIMPAADPAAARAVTTDGTASDPYTWVAQDDQGRILALAGPAGTAAEELLRMDQHGRLLQPPISMSRAAERSDLSVSPGGELVAFTLVGEGPWWPHPMVGGSFIMRADGQGGAQSSTTLAGAFSPSWSSNSEVVLTTDNSFWTYRVGEDDRQFWFQACGFPVEETACSDHSEINRQMQWLASTRYLSSRVLYLWRLTGAPPARPTLECELELSSGRFSRPSWSPDGTSLVVDVNAHDTAPNGLYRIDGIGTATCEQLVDSFTLVMAGAFRPDWGPASVAPPTGPVQPPPTGPVQPPPPAHACPTDRVPASGFTDITGSTHAANIDCIVWWEITRGISPDRYGPTLNVRRDQMASFLARMILNAGGTLPAPADQGYGDIAGNPHADNINRLAAAGVARGTAGTSFSPRNPVRRDQMASFLIRAYEHLAGQPLTATRDHFADTAGNPHLENINKAAEAGIATGTTPATFEPSRAVRRDQMASFIARSLGLAVREGHATTPE